MGIFRKKKRPEPSGPAEVTLLQMAGFLDRDIQNGGKYPWPEEPSPCYCETEDGILLFARSPGSPGKVRYFETESEMRSYLRSGEDCSMELPPR